MITAILIVVIVTLGLVVLLAYYHVQQLQTAHQTALQTALQTARSKKQSKFDGTFHQHISEKCFRYVIHRMKGRCELPLFPLPLANRWVKGINEQVWNEFYETFANGRLPSFFPRLERDTSCLLSKEENKVLATSVERVCAGLAVSTYYWEFLMMYGPFVYLSMCMPTSPMDHKMLRRYLVQLDYFRWSFVKTGPQSKRFKNFRENGTTQVLWFLRERVLAEWDIQDPLREARLG